MHETLARACLDDGLSMVLVCLLLDCAAVARRSTLSKIEEILDSIGKVLIGKRDPQPLESGSRTAPAWVRCSTATPCGVSHTVSGRPGRWHPWLPDMKQGNRDARLPRKEVIQPHLPVRLP